MTPDKNAQIIQKLLHFYGVEVSSIPPELTFPPLLPESIQTPREILARKVASRFLALLPESLFLAITKSLKYCLQTPLHSDIENDGAFEEFIRENRTDEKGIWSNELPPLVITHDIDLNSCYRNIQKVAKIEDELGISSTWHFLTSGRYKLENAVLRDLHQSGHEIGLHGTWHDIAIGFRSRNEIEDFVKTGLEPIKEFSPVSFRAPALAWTPKLAEIILKHGFRADSSLKTYGNGWDIKRPIPLEDGKLWELPLTIQDDYLFKNLRLTNQEAGELLLNMLASQRKKRCPAILNFHPSIIASRLDWYRETLMQIQNSGLWNITTIKGCIGELDMKWNPPQPTQK